MIHFNIFFKYYHSALLMIWFWFFSFCNGRPMSLLQGFHFLDTPSFWSVHFIIMIRYIGSIRVNNLAKKRLMTRLRFQWPVSWTGLPPSIKRQHRRYRYHADIWVKSSCCSNSGIVSSVQQIRKNIVELRTCSTLHVQYEYLT